ncbi:helix-turn-helix transcriptional regulator [Gilvimarinus sp. DA14]|uniref:helix-turn-helix transcriptional regulator n=1 Tax=Gilvimarinus sp. DA14 TaxID=2956798 RepID=UPI0020B6581A|nr:helix-turn-helix transcriptional regulator [Gilvimarinus sp. DA14]UTF60847.1 helix-turn-helix transcriptional regulator [Gilvimarinus sp. DA14]
MNSSDLELIDQVYAATTREGSLKNATRTFLQQQNDLAGAILHYDPIKTCTHHYEPVSRNADQEALIRALLDQHINKTGQLRDPLILSASQKLKAGELLLSDELLSYDEFSQTDYYQTVLKPLGARHSMGWVAWGTDQTWQIFTSSRDACAGKYGREERHRAKLFQRHFARAMYTLELLSETRNTQLVFEQAIDKVPQALMLVDEQLNVLFHNAATHQLLMADKSISIMGNKLRLGTSAHEKSRFDSWWQLLNHTRINDGARFNPSDASNIWELEASRVSSSPIGKSTGQHWLLTLKQQPTKGERPIPYLTQKYGLSEAEAKVCFALCDTGDAVSTAQILGIAANTARIHLKHIFKKTGYKNQVQLAVNITAETT